MLSIRVYCMFGLALILGRALQAAQSSATSTQPPHSSVIREIQWAPKDTILRKAKGSDNWPMTWAKDDALYTAYGDGNGFEPFLPVKLSLGFAKVLGNASTFSGVNLRSTGEQLGDGARGKKASGLLMVNGILYLWARNATNSQLGWSQDHSATWAWSDWRFTNSFGCPTFLNFGPNYTQARDSYVYIYSPDQTSAYQRCDQLALARVPFQGLKDRNAYEFFQRLDAEGRPVWTKDLQARSPVLSNPARCYRPSVSYNAGLKRYLLVMTVPTPRSRDQQGRLDTRFTGGLAIYDAAEPWGPWTTAFVAEEWDVGPGDSASFPTKWISEDGRTLHLVFSGDDSFAVRRATLLLQ